MTLTNAQWEEAIVQLANNPSSGGGGTQYTDGGTPPANPIGPTIIWDNSGAWVDVGLDHPLPVQGTFWQATQPVSGTFWQATQPVSVSSLPLPSGAALETGGNLATLAGAITGTVLQANNKQVNGTTISVNAGTVDAGTQRVVQGSAATGTKSNVVSSASSVTILAANTSRKGAMIYNDSTQILYLDLSGGTASTSSYSVQVGAQAFFELPGPIIYNGLITGIWASANGNARVTEFS